MTIATAEAEAEAPSKTERKTRFFPKKTEILRGKTIQECLKTAKSRPDTIFYADLALTKEDLEWILKNTNNSNYRPLSEAKAKEYARLHDEGLLSWSPEGYSWNIDLQLDNGQHRVTGALRAKTSESLFAHCTFNVPLDVAATYDNGKNRTYTDFLRARFKILNADEAGTIIKRQHFGYSGSMGRIYNSELERLFPIYQEGIEFTIDAFQNALAKLAEKQAEEAIALAKETGKPTKKIAIRKKRNLNRLLPGVTTATVKSVFARAFFSRPDDLERIEAFINSLVLGDASGGNDDWIPKLRTYLMNADTAGASNQIELYGKTERALKGWLDALPIPSSLYKVSEEQFDFDEELLAKVENLGIPNRKEGEE